MRLAVPPTRPLGLSFGGRRRPVGIWRVRGGAGEVQVSQLVARWLHVDTVEESRAEILELQKQGRNEELVERLGNSLQFGTAGLRGLEGAGFNRMNTTTVQQTSQGVLQHLETVFGVEEVRLRGVVIGFDARRRSKEYAETVARVFMRKGVVVHLFGREVPTPFVAYGVKHLGCVAGVMITASHNPKEYNGYKLYWENGCQIIQPIDSQIASCIDDNLHLWDLTNCDLSTSTLVTDPLVPLSSAYFSSIREHLKFGPSPCPAPAMVYSPLHGVGARYVAQAFAAFGMEQPIMVPEQEHPDPEFPTVSFPNPEEGRNVFDLSFKTADKHGASVVLVNDPDGDRLSVAERAHGKWRIFSGNEIGLLLGHWVWDNVKKTNPVDPAHKFAMISTVVSSRMLSRLAKREGFQFFQTLTGFKWLGNKAIELEKLGYKVLFGFEEAIGFMLKGPVTDKDGVSAAVVFAEMVSCLFSQGTSIHQFLELLSSDLGGLEYRSGSFQRSPQDIRHFFDHLRNTGYPKTIAGFKVEWICDLGQGIDTSKPGGQTDLPWRKGDLMISLGLQHDGWITLRGSGTEPKLKYYLEVGNMGTIESQTAADCLEQAVANMLGQGDPAPS